MTIKIRLFLLNPPSQDAGFAHAQTDGGPDLPLFWVFGSLPRADCPAWLGPARFGPVRSGWALVLVRFWCGSGVRASAPRTAAPNSPLTSCDATQEGTRLLPQAAALPAFY